MSSHSVYDHDYVPGSGPELHYYRCGRTCNAVTVKAIYTRRYERCRGCGSMALYQFSVPVETDEHKAIHAKGVVFQPHVPQAPDPFICVRCGANVTGKQLPRYRADGKVCRNCYFAEDVAAEAEREQSINQSTQEMK